MTPVANHKRNQCFANMYTIDAYVRCCCVLASSHVQLTGPALRVVMTFEER